MSLRERLRRRGNGGQGTSGPSAAATLADAAPPDGPNASPMAALEVVVPLELGAELVVAAAAATPSAGRATRRAPLGHVPASPISASEFRLELHRRLIDRLDLEALDTITDERQLAQQVRAAVTDLLLAENTPLSPSERDEIVEHVVYEVAGLGPIEPFVRDPTVTEIVVNGAKHVCIERGGRRSRVNASFRNDTHLLTVIDRLVSRAGRRVDDASPMVDARLPDGSRVHAIVPPLALDGPVLSIRRPASDADIESLTANGTLTGPMAMLLAAYVRARINILISGGPASGKTTLMNAVGAVIPAAERVVTIEHAAELRLKQEHVVRLETRPANGDGRGEVSARDLVRNAVRLRPTRIIVGELQGDEALDVLQAMHTGHEGSMATIYATSPRDALSRLENMVLLARAGLPAGLVREQIAATVGVIVQLAHQSDGKRRVTSITEVVGIEGDAIATSEVFTFRHSGVVNGRALGRFEATGVRPRFTERFQIAGVALPARIFDGPGVEDAATPLDTDDFGGTDAPGASPQQADSVDDVEEMRAQVVAARHALDTLHLEVEEQRELQAMLQHRSRSLAVAVLGFVEVLDELIEAADPSADEAMRGRHQRLRDGAGRLLALFGLSEIVGVGGPVDDTQHEIVQRVPARDHPSGTVVAIVQRGFTYHGQLVRRAQVVAAE